MAEAEERPEKTIYRSLLVAASNVINLSNTNEFDSSTMGEMRELAFKLLSKGDFSKVIDYTQPPKDYTIVEDDKNWQCSSYNVVSS